MSRPPWRHHGWARFLDRRRSLDEITRATHVDINMPEYHDPYSLDTGPAISPYEPSGPPAAPMAYGEPMPSPYDPPEYSYGPDRPVDAGSQLPPPLQPPADVPYQGGAVMTQEFFEELMEAVSPGGGIIEPIEPPPGPDATMAPGDLPFGAGPEPDPFAPPELPPG